MFYNQIVLKEVMEIDQQCRVILNNYFYLVYERYGSHVPDEAEWRFPQLPANVPWQVAVEVPRMLMELGEINEDTRISPMVQLCEYFSEHVNESNCLNMYSSTMAIMLQRASDTSLGELQVFCAFSAAYCIYLHKHNVDEDAVKEVYVTVLKLFEARFKWWQDCDQRWVSNPHVLQLYFKCFLLYRKCS